MFRVQGSGFRVQGSGFRVHSLGYLGLGFRFRVGPDEGSLLLGAIACSILGSYGEPTMTLSRDRGQAA